MLHSMLRNHKKTVLIGGNGFSVDCKLKKDASEEGWDLKGFSTFVGLTFEESGHGFFGDSFEVTIDVEDVLKYTDLRPSTGWYINVTIPQLNNEEVDFYIEDVAIDRTLGLYLCKCTAATTQGEGRRINRNHPGGI